MPNKKTISTMNFDCGIYAIISPSGSRYIGQTISISRRWKEHKKELRAGRHHCKPLQIAWNKHGENAMQFSKIAIVPPEQLNLREQEQFDSYIESGNRKFLYNTTLSARPGMRGRTHSPETIAKIVAANTGKKRGPRSRETIEKIAASLRGKPFTEERKKKLSVAHKGKPRPYRAGANNPTAKAIICVETGMRFETQVATARWLRENGYPKAKQAKISHVCLGKGKIAYGYQWRFADHPCVTVTPDAETRK
jgi:group I intron endonuclease